MNDLKLFPIQARWFLILWFVPQIWDPTQLIFDMYVIEKVLAYSVDEHIHDSVFDLSFYFYNAIRTTALIAFCFLITRTSIPRFIAPFQTKLLWPSIEITSFTFFASGALIYLSFYPLSLVAPDFIQFWFIELPPIVYVDNGAFPFWPNFLSLVSLAILAPLTEEFVFRGILLQRWGSKYGSKVAILLSSAIFASLHTDPFGAFLFGILMCYLMIRSGSILLPMICHALYNASVWGIELVRCLLETEKSTYTLAEFYSEWPYAIFFTALSIIWALRLFARIPNIDTWRIPVLYSQT